MLHCYDFSVLSTRATWFLLSGKRTCRLGHGGRCRRVADGDREGPLVRVIAVYFEVLDACGNRLIKGR